MNSLSLMAYIYINLINSLKLKLYTFLLMVLRVEIYLSIVHPNHG